MSDKASGTLFGRSARDLVEGLTLDASLLSWCREKCPELDPEEELEAFKDWMRRDGYKTARGAVRDAVAAFRTHMRNRKGWQKKGQPTKSREIGYTRSEWQTLFPGRPYGQFPPKD